MAKQKSGFTLVELLIVVGILAVLATVTVLILNPAQMIHQSRDSTRMNDLQTINKAINLSKAMGSIVDATQAKRVYISLPDTNNNIIENCNVDYPALPALAADWQYRCVLNADLRRIDGFGWIPINFSSVPSIQPPLVVLPVDPINNPTSLNYYAYGYDTDQNVYALSSKLDSEKYLLDSAPKDGGNDNTAFETRPIAWLAGGGGGGGGIGKYWVGGTGSWSDATNHWATSSGGAPGAGNLPTSTDDVFFDSASAGAAYTVTVDVAANTADMTWANPVAGVPTLAGSAALNIYGSLSLVSGMTRTYTGAITFAATTTGKTIITNGVTLSSVITFSGVGGSWILQSSLNNSSSILVSTGTFDTNGQTVTSGSTFGTTGTNSNVRIFSFGASSISTPIFNMGGVSTTGPTLTINAGTSTITVNQNNAFVGAGKTYNNVNLVGSNTWAAISDSNTFANLTVTGAAIKTHYLQLSANQTVTGTLTLNGNSAVNRLLVWSSTVGTARTLTAANVSVSNADFQDIVGAGIGNWDLSAIAGGSGDAGGNSGIIFTPAQNHYWVATSGGNWSATTSWSTLSGGASGARVPLSQDNVFIDANSITSASRIIYADMPRLGKDINFTGALNSPSFALNNSIDSFGSIIMPNSIIILDRAYVWSLKSRSNIDINILATLKFDLYIDSFGATATLQNDLVLDVGTNANWLQLRSGTFNANNFNVTADLFTSTTTSPRTLIMGSGIWTIKTYGFGVGAWNVTSSGLTVNAGTSTIKFTDATANTKTFTGGGKTYYNFWNATAGTGIVVINGSNTFNDFKIDAGRTQQFAAGTTQTVASITANGAAGNLATLRSTSSPTKWIISAVSTSVSYVDVMDSTGSGTASPFSCGATCVNSGNNTGWTF